MAQGFDDLLPEIHVVRPAGNPQKFDHMDCSVTLSHAEPRYVSERSITEAHDHAAAQIFHS